MRQTIKESLARIGLLSLGETFYRTFTSSGRQLGQQISKLENAVVALYGQFVQPGDLCFDVGANLGNRTAALLRLGAAVVTVEPQESAMRYLRMKYERDQRVHLVQAALGEHEGQLEMYVGSNSPTSTLSREWMEKIRQRPKFASHVWDKTIVVPVTTMDALIATYGKPAFCKIDVEGYELPVLTGLSQPIRALSFEYTPEYIAPTYTCIRRLMQLGRYEFNVSLRESMLLENQTWLSSEAIIALLEQQAAQGVPGDVYARLAG